MSFKGIRQSKFRHVFGKPEKKDKGFDGINKLTRNAWDSNFCDVNPLFLAVVLEAQGGGAFTVFNLENPGRIPLNHPKVCGHTAAVLDIQFNPFNDYQIASCGEDCTVKVWEIPEGGLVENIMEPIQDMEGHQRRVGIVQWHPTAANVLASAGFDYVIFIWNVETGTPISEIECHSDTIYSMSWNWDGSLIATSCKDKVLRVIDPRQGTVVTEGTSHEGSKPARVCFLGQMNRLFTTGFSKMSERQFALWDLENLKKPLAMESIDSASGVLFPFYDNDTQMVYLAGKGDGNIRYYEISEDAPYVFYLSEYASKDPQRGNCIMPKRGCNINACETVRFYKLHPNNFVEVIPMTVPRKATVFQADIFPDTKEDAPVLTADEWAGGANKTPNMISLKDGFVASSRAKASDFHSMNKTAAAKAKPAGGSIASATAAKAAAPAAPAAAASNGKEVADLKKKIAALEAENTKIKAENTDLKGKVDASATKIKQLQSMLQ